MEVEDITRVGLATWGTTKQKRHLTVGDGLLGKIVVDHKRVLAVVTEVLAHGGAGVRGKVLEGGSVRGSGADNDGVLQGICA